MMETPKKNNKNYLTNIKETQRRTSQKVTDHLANERTYLAWMRTSISLMGFGVVIARLRLFVPPTVPTPGNGWKLGLIFSLVGLSTVLFATKNYFGVRHNIDANAYEPPGWGVIVFSFSLMLLGGGVIYYLFTVPLNPLSGLVFE